MTDILVCRDPSHRGLLALRTNTDILGYSRITRDPDQAIVALEAAVELRNKEIADLHERIGSKVIALAFMLCWLAGYLMALIMWRVI